MKTHYKNNLKQAFLIIEGEEIVNEDFRARMLQENEIPGLLKTDIKYIDNICHYQYDISGKASLKTLHEKGNLSREEIKKLVRALLHALKEVEKYMLDGDGILLDPEYIYLEKENYFFCYYPPLKSELQGEFHRLTEYFVREVDYKDKEGVHLAYTLHKASMEENYSIEKIMDEAMREEEVEVRYEERIEETAQMDMDDQGLIEEKHEFWEPVRKLLERRKQQKWGFWDEISK